MKKLSKKEITFYVIAAVIGAIGLFSLVLGIVGEHLPVLASDNWILTSEAAWLSNWSHMGYRFWGLILIGAAVLLTCICLTVFAREGDRDTERALRRAQRLGQAKQPTDE
ncbi:MAG: hypothetical protein K6F32_07820 [Bacilli bacterium]|nr:hypothetical protein [Bacilli bacterium]